MAKPIPALEGKKINSWTVIQRAPNAGTKIMWLCKCDCGTETTVPTGNLVYGKSTKCRACRAKSITKHGDAKKGGLKALYYCWQDMKSRCYNPNNSEYHNYGARGITVCSRWLDNYSNFKEDMFESWAPKLSIERIDNNKGYYKENCRWVTQKEQMRNQRRNRWVETAHTNLVVVDTADFYGINKSTLRGRIKANLPLDLVLYRGKLSALPDKIKKVVLNYKK